MLLLYSLATCNLHTVADAQTARISADLSCTLHIFRNLACNEGLHWLKDLVSYTQANDPQTGALRAAVLQART
jgi:predicted O-linked N-acetylglucosamine transferase (SPINDLY family)